jgi:hypothetical protein
MKNREQFIADNTGSHNFHVTLSIIRLTAAETVTADAVLRGGDIPAPCRTLSCWGLPRGRLGDPAPRQPLGRLSALACAANAG